MTTWSKVSWTDAGQVLKLISPKKPVPGDAGVAPDAYCRTLVERGDLEAAVKFIGAAVPRYEAIVWATQVLRTRWAQGRTDPIVAAILQWVDDPSDARRRAIYAMAQDDDDSPAGLLGMAVFYSGGSISQPDLPAILPPPEVCGVIASGAVLNAAYSQPDSDTVLREAIRFGEAVASQRELA